MPKSNFMFPQILPKIDQQSTKLQIVEKKIQIRLRGVSDDGAGAFKADEMHLLETLGSSKYNNFPDNVKTYCTKKVSNGTCLRNRLTSPAMGIVVNFYYYV